MGKILIIMTRAKTLTLLDGTAYPSGFWAEELVVPYERFVAAGYDVDIATSGGVAPTPDRGSLTVSTVRATRPASVTVGGTGSEVAESIGSETEDVAHYRTVIEETAALLSPLSVGNITAEDLAGYDGVYIAGGHGAMEDMPKDVDLTLLLSRVLQAEQPLAAVCHGHSALLPLRDTEGEWPLAGYRMTAFSHSEELVTNLVGRLPFVLQVELERLGAQYQKSPEIWGSTVVRDRSLMTGQNPHSSADLADAFVGMLKTG